MQQPRRISQRPSLAEILSGKHTVNVAKRALPRMTMRALRRTSRPQLNKSRTRVSFSATGACPGRRRTQSRQSSDLDEGQEHRDSMVNERSSSVRCYI